MRSSRRSIAHPAAVLVALSILIAARDPRAPSLHAETGAPPSIVYRIDPARSRVSFTLPATLHTVEGNTSSVTGEFTRPADAAPSGFPVAGRIAIDAKTLDTGNRTRDKRMRAESLAVDTWPEIVFLPRKAGGAGISFVPGSESKMTLEGDLTIRGITKPASIALTVKAAARGIAADGTTTVAFPDFGVPDPSNFFLHVRTTVTILFHIEAESLDR